MYVPLYVREGLISFRHETDMLRFEGHPWQIAAVQRGLVERCDSIREHKMFGDFCQLTDRGIKGLRKIKSEALKKLS